MSRLASLRLLAALPTLALAIGACSRNEEARRDATAAARSATAGPAAGGVAAGGAGAAGASTPAAPDAETGRADAARIAGDSAAPLWLVVVSDFQCPYCKTWEDQTAPTLMREYVQAGRVRMAFINLPLTSIHPNALPAAEAAMCAGAQGKFWPVHDALFATQPQWAKSTTAGRTFDSLAVAAGADAAAFRRCVESKAMRPLVQADAQRATDAGVQSTPTFLISSRAQPNASPTAIQGAVPLATFRATLDSLLRDAAGAARR